MGFNFYTASKLRASLCQIMLLSCLLIFVHKGQLSLHEKTLKSNVNFRGNNYSRANLLYK